MVESRDGSTKPWMIWWKEEIEASGYNRYVVLKMTHLLTWRDVENVQHEQWAFFSGPGNSNITDTLKSQTGEAIYKENNNLYMFVTPYNKNVVRDMYLEIQYKETTSAYVVMESDVNSTPGVIYVTADSSYIRDKSAQDDENPQSAADFWFNGGSN